MSIYFNLGLFIVCILIAFGMIAHKMWLFKAGKISASSYEEADWTDLSIESIRERLLELIKIAVHRIVLWSLKIWIVSAHFVRRCDKIVREKMIHFLHRHQHYAKTTDQKPSDFLTDIKEHHDEVMKNIEKGLEE